MERTTPYQAFPIDLPEPSDPAIQAWEAFENAAGSEIVATIEVVAVEAIELGPEDLIDDEPAHAHPRWAPYAIAIGAAAAGLGAALFLRRTL